MPNINLRGIGTAEARILRRLARAQREPMVALVVGSGLLRADLDEAAKALLRAGVPVPPCPVAQALTLEGESFSLRRFLRHSRACPICTAGALEAVRRHDKEPKVGWARLAEAAGIPLDDAMRRFDVLSTRLRRIVSDVYGLDDPPRSMAQAGTRHGVSRERIRQLLKAAIAELGRAAATSAPAGRSG